MKNAKLILSQVAEAIASGHSVFMTDGTVTRKVIKVEITDFNLSFGKEGTFDVLWEFVYCTRLVDCTLGGVKIV